MYRLFGNYLIFKLSIPFLLEPQEIGTIFPSKQLVYTGEPIHLSCHSIGDFRVRWSKDKKQIPLKFLRLGGHTINIPNADKTHAGTYYCVGYNLKGKPFRTAAEVFVEGKYTL